MQTSRQSIYGWPIGATYAWLLRFCALLPVLFVTLEGHALLQFLACALSIS